MQLSALSEVLLIVGILLFLAAIIFKRYPPPTINGLYGYRTRRSMSSPEAWVFAQKKAAGLMLRLATFMLISGVISLFVNSREWSKWWIPVILLAIVFVGFAVLFYKVEKALRKQFDKPI